jgi:hypothetical protein
VRKKKKTLKAKKEVGSYRARRRRGRSQDCVRIASGLRRSPLRARFAPLFGDDLLFVLQLKESQGAYKESRLLARGFRALLRQK